MTSWRQEGVGPCAAAKDYAINRETDARTRPHLDRSCSLHMIHKSVDTLSTRTVSGYG